MSDELTDAFDRIFQNMESTMDFDLKLANLVMELDDAPIRLKNEYMASMIAAAACAVARCSMYHVEDHDGVDCARIQVGTAIEAFPGQCKDICGEIAKEKGLVNPFAASDTNADVAAEIMAEIDKEDS